MSEASDDPVRRERLEQLARVVRETPDHLFDMRLWGKTTECGTVGCAAGHAYFDPWFREHTPILNCFRETSYGSLFGGVNVGLILREIFRLSRTDCDALFLPEIAGVTKDMVLRNIRRLIDGQRAIPYAYDQIMKEGQS